MLVNVVKIFGIFLNVRSHQKRSFNQTRIGNFGGPLSARSSQSMADKTAPVTGRNRPQGVVPGHDH